MTNYRGNRIMKRQRAERIYHNHIAPYHNCDVATVSIHRHVPTGKWEGYWETLDRIPVEPLGVDENGDEEYENRYVSWGDVHVIQTESEIIRALENDTPLYIIPRYLCYGDYDSSCAVERSNYRLFMAEYGGESFGDDYGSEEGNCTFRGVHAMSGGHGSTGVAISLDTWLRYEEMREVVGKLDGYPCISDEDVSRVEMVLADEAWESWVEHGFKRELEDKFGIEGWKESDTFDSDFRLFFENVRESVNEYWEVESGGNSHVRIERIVDAIASLEWAPPQSCCNMPLCLNDFVESVEVSE